MKYVKREVAEAQERQVEAEHLTDFYRRTEINKALGMSARNPYAFQLSDEELGQAEADVAAGMPPLPIAVASNGLRMLVDPLRDALRRQKRDALPPETAEERRRYLLNNRQGPERREP